MNDKQLTFDDLPVPELHLSGRDKFAMQHSRRGDHDTSIEAAQNAHSNAARHRDLALAAHYAHMHTGLTDFELAEITGIQQASIGVRRGELRNQGYIIATRIRRPSPTGSPATVWVITNDGMHHHETTRGG